MIKRVMLIILLGSCVTLTVGQSKKTKSPKQIVLFKLKDKPVMADEFIYLYNKNHQAKPDEYSKESIQEYLRLFINFKLKVEEAKHRGMDTTASFLTEYNSYRNELLKPYLPDSKIIDSLVTLTYQRLKEEVRASHLLITLKPDAAPEDTLKAYNKILELKQRAEAGEDFGTLAEKYSEDPSARVNKGDLGYFTALQMVYPFETTAYETPVGTIGGPVRTQFGYHLVKVTDRKPARGEVEVSHIMIRTGNGKDDEKAKNTIFSIYDQLMAGASWDDLCRQYSEDQSSKENGGRLRPFGVGAMGSVPEFEKTAFSLKNPGDISDPFKTAFGWHIVRLEKKSALPSFEELAPQLKTKVARDERLQISKQAFREKLKKEYHFAENAKEKALVMSMADSSLSAGSWKAPEIPGEDNAVLFSLEGKNYAVKDFLAYAAKNQKPVKPETAMEHLYDSYVDEKLMKLTDEKVSQSHPEFRMLANEYYEGILLFAIMEEEVWNKAAQDSAGQYSFYDKNRDRYQAGERVKAEFYSSASRDLIDSLQKIVEAGDTSAVGKFVLNNNIKYEKGAYEKGDKSILMTIKWAPGIYSTQNSGMYYLAWIHDILPPGPKTFDEARAAVIADYQQELEQQWIDQLKGKYPVKVNEKGKRYVLEKLQK